MPRRKTQQRAAHPFVILTGEDTGSEADEGTQADDVEIGPPAAALGEQRPAEEIGEMGVGALVTEYLLLADDFPGVTNLDASGQVGGRLVAEEPEAMAVGEKGTDAELAEGTDRLADPQRLHRLGGSR